MLFRGTAIVSALTLLSRLLGFVRDLLVARLLGASVFADAFFVAFRIPNLLRSFVAEGALTSAFTPVFSSSLAKGKESAAHTLARITGFLILLTTILTILMIGFAPQIVGLLAPGFAADPKKLALCVSLTRIMAPYIACVSLVAMLNAALNTLGIFGTSAWAQVIMNVVLIAGAICAIPTDLTTATTILAGSVLIGGFVQIAAQLPACRRNGLSLLPTLRIWSGDVFEVLRLMIPATIGASIYQITIFIATLLASLLPTGSVSWLFYADRVAQFPIGVFSIALASVLLPALANASANADTDTFHKRIADSLRFTSFCIIPMAVGIWTLALPITQLLFQRGEFSPESSVKTAQALRALSLGLWASSCHSMLVRAFIARKDTITPTAIGICALIINIAAALLLVGPLSLGENPQRLVSSVVNLQTSLRYLLPWHGSFGHVGLALASSVAAFGSFLLVVGLFAVRIRNFPWRVFTSSTLKAGLAAASMMATLNYFGPLWPTPLVECTMGMIIGPLVFGAVAFMVRSRELLDCIAVIRLRLAKPR